MPNKEYYAYIRVSTVKQGEQGVSLQEQRDAIARYADRNDLAVGEWFEEKVTAAKRGRPVFGRMLKCIKAGKAAGVIIHKIDRGARNLKDWADLGGLIDQGVEVHFANESLDLTSRGGRLSADIQAVVAADYIRNLREETRKGFYGRLKQGLYPLPAPIGYVDRGGGQAKEPDPVRAPLVRQIFDLYATGRFTLRELVGEAKRIGLTNRRGGPVTRNGLSTLLNNPFYIGIIRIKKTDETFQGIHAPIIPSSLFKRVQQVLEGKVNPTVVAHAFLFRRLISCALCGYSLIGERQKGYIYYRCHTKHCPTKCVRESALDRIFHDQLEELQFNDNEKRYFDEALEQLKVDSKRHQQALVQSDELRLAQMDDRLDRLTDALIDRLIDKDDFERRKKALLVERKQIEDRVREVKGDKLYVPRCIERYLERSDTALLTYKVGLPEEKREMLEIVTSNRQVREKNVDVKLSMPYACIAKRPKSADGGPYRDRPRTFEKLIAQLVRFAEDEKIREKSDSTRDVDKVN